MRPEFQAMQRASQYYISPQVREEAQRLRDLSKQTGKSIRELEGLPPLTQADIEEMEFAANFESPEVLGG